MDHFSIELGQIRLQASVHRIEKNGSKKTLFFFFRSDVFFDPLGDDNQPCLTRLDRKSADGDFLQLAPWRSGKQRRIDLGENFKSF